ncbi:nuclear receptor subfamily 5 group A member 2-like isoform X2 [Gigantopelta aegis]|uniref:nuclear receptor subfamily 5 group A member 2-like isoform X2 n=1 Tax=Gigantopelta aegis TaxID=1735272 RepID=UPI001B88B9AE|nr:nuclear receptor subfamily 5 group A member 2-like isoform X2 [Gigantopelta aegis]
MIQTSEKADSNLEPASPVNSLEEQAPSADQEDSAVEASTSGGDGQYPPDIKIGFDELCPVCGDKVSGYHYGLLTCESCKGFFKRTVQNKKVYSCVDNRSCHIDKSQRKRCPYCRFQKCISVGMKLEAVRSDRMRGGRNKFGPMYKRDRALKQQALRQQQSLVAHCQLRLANGMSPVPGSPEDVKPDLMFMSSNSNTSHHSMSSSPGPLPLQPLNCPSPPIHHSGLGSHSPPMSGLSMSIGHRSIQSHHDSYGHGHSPSYPTVMDALRNYQTSTFHHHQSQPFMAIMPQLVADLKSGLVEEGEVKRKLMTFFHNEFGHMDIVSQPIQFLHMLCKMVDQLLFLMVEWARNSCVFKELKVEDQMKLLQNSWSEILILDLVYRQVQDSWSSEIILSNGQRINFDILDKLGLGDVKARLYELIKKMKELKIDVYEYACLKFLILLNPDVSGLDNRQYVEQSQEKVNAALLQYCLNFYPDMKDKFGQILLRLPEIRVISIRAEEYLYFRHLNGEVPDQTLLLEMLHSRKK